MAAGDPQHQSLRDDAGRLISFDQPDCFVYETTVQPEAIDGQGHVNNAVYVQWMDRAAFAHSCAVGYDWAAYQQLGASFVVRRHEVEYLAPAFLGQKIVDATWPGEMDRFTAMRQHQIIRLNDGVTLARAVTTWIYLDLKTGRPRRIPAEMIAAFRPR
ncbi:MAG: acyl-CoA thioesterase [Phycisphaeraceae bacterium]|nr:acyl-CoA thioesterase [Phycisphaeraceae bacterium]